MVVVTMMVMAMVAVMVMKAVFALNLPAHCLTSPTLRETSGKKEDLRLSSSISGVFNQTSGGRQSSSMSSSGSPVCSSESLFELMLRVLRVFERREGIESREQEDKSNNSMVGAHLVSMVVVVVKRKVLAIPEKPMKEICSSFPDQ